jgi:hypothetical protein
MKSRFTHLRLAGRRRAPDPVPPACGARCQAPPQQGAAGIVSVGGMGDRAAP